MMCAALAILSLNYIALHYKSNQPSSLSQEPSRIFLNNPKPDFLKILIISNSFTLVTN